MNILIKFATRGRSQYFLEAMRNIASTIGNVNYQVLVSVDEDDANSLDICNSQVDKPYGFVFRNSIKDIAPRTSKIGAINRGMDNPKIKPWDILVNMSDDMKFIKQNWGLVLIDMVKHRWQGSTDFFAHFDDGVVGEALATMSIIGRQYYERDGYIYYPEYKSFSCDAEAYYVAILRGCHHYFAGVKMFTHQHPSSSPRPNDETYQHNSLATAHDTELYFHRLNNNFFTGWEGPTPFDQFKTLK